MTSIHESVSASDSQEIPQSSLASSSTPSPSTQTNQTGFWRVFASTFGTIFLAEIGDKTQLATLLMSAESGKPWIVFFGAGTALITTSLIGVALGQWVARKVSPHTLDTAAGTLLLAITIWLLWDVANV
ncbi:TMEM165/GDT1 family protein [Oscillatoria sp. CS-180]|uniref:TMEM165/GDT1 family protein n=1 Tax=Oscillatoria sp. CS-180 TaxID=3021720 RepID=UPI002331565D|nr:TMEM165/GDT1 family protein [Oscillatoria sp. CS-180]MDB9524966.1 TMEM165/GDT1 family protein [Oscillatoria sp. CS-180]